jgi:hypothetical protein
MKIAGYDDRLVDHYCKALRRAQCVIYSENVRRRKANLPSVPGRGDAACLAASAALFAACRQEYLSEGGENDDMRIHCTWLTAEYGDLFEFKLYY